MVCSNYPFSRGPQGLSAPKGRDSFWKYGGQALIDAAWNGKASVVEALLVVMQSDDMDLSPNDDKARHAALRNATQKGYLDIVQLLLEYGGDPLDRETGGDSALEIGVKSGNIHVVQALIHEADISSPEHSCKPTAAPSPANSVPNTQLGLTMDEIALLRHHQQVVASTALHDAKPPQTTDFYVRLSISFGYTEIATMFADVKNWMNFTERHSFPFPEPTLLFIAAANGHTQAVQFLLEKGAAIHQSSKPAGDLLQSNSRGATYFSHLQTNSKGLERTPLWAAAVCGYEDIVALLLGSSKNMESPLSLEQCPLYQAAKIGHLKVVNLLLEAGVDPRPSLLAHINSKHNEIVRRLVEADLHLKPGESWGLFDTKEIREKSYLITIATRCGQTEIVRYLLSAGSKTADKEKDGMSALLWAIQYGYVDIVELLLDHRALFKADESQKERALKLAVTRSQTNLALLLLARHSREWGETTDGVIFKRETLIKVGYPPTFNGAP